jgi:ABC-type nickel/cobalt efflux system permease component RcnA
MSFRKALLTCLIVLALGAYFLAVGALNWRSDKSYALVEVVSGAILFPIGVMMLVQLVRFRSTLR